MLMMIRNLRRRALAVLVLSASVAFSSLAFAQRTHVTAPMPTPTPVIPADKTATHSPWSFLSLGATHTDDFQREHPTYDGRGVIVFIFDTGVDPTVPGLLETSQGSRKVIDVRDFSGTGDVTYVSAQRESDELRVSGRTVLKGMNSVNAKPVDGQYYYGVLPEKRFQNGLADLNFDGNDTDSFGILIFQDATSHYVAYLDSDGDGDLADEHQLTNYHERFDVFQFHSKDSVASSGKRLGGAINIYPEQKLVSVYFDDGSHGTHVAGIAAGHDIDNQKGFNGVAPGAEVIACKFADNTAGGVTVSGSMQRAFEFAAETARSQAKPVVVNMSFGIGNELEGSSMMDRWLDSLLAATPNLAVCISAGNEGPGLSSIGLPGSAERVITSGAALPDDAARDLYKLYLTRPVVFDFSSRGGELAKPDLVSPGTAVSTVPDYVSGDRYNGTSMSSPYTAGCAAVLLSAMTQAFPLWTPNANELKRAMMLSAHHIEGATPLDEGYGMIDVPAAFEMLSHWQRRANAPRFVHVEASIPSAIRTGTAAYYRAGNYPTDGELETFVVEPEEVTTNSFRERAVGMEAYDLVSEVPWMTPLESSIYHRGGGVMNVEVRYNPKLLQAPGFYCGRILGYQKGAARTRENVRFELVNTIALPYTFTDQNDYHVSLADMRLAPGVVQREFFTIPPGAKSAKVSLTVRDERGACTVRMFDNAGHEFSGLSLRRNAAQRTTTQYLSGRDMPPGVWEIDLSRTMVSEDERDIPVDLTVEVQPLDIHNLATFTDEQERPHVRAEVTNPTSQPYSADPEADILGYDRTIDTVIASGDSFTMPFSPRDGERLALFDISMPATDWDLFTDVTCMVLKPDSSALFNSAFDYRYKMVPVNFSNLGSIEPSQDDEEDTLPHAESSASAAIVAHAGSEKAKQGTPKFSLYIRGGLALPNQDHPWHLRIHEYRYLENDRSLTRRVRELKLPPFETGELEFTSTKPLMELPAGYRPFGQIELRKTDSDIIRLPIEF